MAGHKQQYAFHERSDAEKVIANGFKNGIANGREAIVVAKYYRQEYEWGETKLERNIIKFCKEHDPNFNEIVQQNSIAYWVKQAMQYEPHDSKNIKIYHSEMKEIKKIKDLKHRKILFTILVLSKAIQGISKSYYLHYGNLAQVITMSGVKITESQLAYILKNFIDADLMYAYTPERESFLIKFATSKGSVAMNIVDPYQSLESYRAFFGGDIVLCTSCGAEIVKTTSRKYCEKCSLEVEKERDKQRKRNKRNSVRKLPFSKV